MKYYALKSKSKDLVVCFVGPVETNLLNSPVEIRSKTVEYLDNVYNLERITKAEAESYAEFGIAPLLLSRDLGIIYFYQCGVQHNNVRFPYYIGYVDTHND